MLELAGALRDWLRQGRAFAVATVVAVDGSAPRQPGAALAVAGDGTAVGSVSGGCVEGTVYELCLRALADGRVLRERFRAGDEDAFAVGLMCGGTMEVLITPVAAGPGRGPGAGPEPVGDATVMGQDAVLAAALEIAAEGGTAALARVADGPGELIGRALLVHPDGRRDGTLGGPPALDRTAAAEARALLAAGRTGTVTVGADGGRCGTPLTLLVECSAPAPRMIVFGAIDFAAALVTVGKFLGYHVTVCDARPVFATAARFPGADEVVVEWPHRYLAATRTDPRTVLCVLTHDAKFDVPLLTYALTLPVAYIGAMGSRRTHADRERRLREAGVGPAALARLRSPIGLDLGARTPQETALSIAAEIVATRHGGSGAALTGAHIPIHHDIRHDDLPRPVRPAVHRGPAA
ncbi:XdhC family protein [Streptomyces yaizuensis]|uniref:XdhC family protein n=1 Tax=Streptomyces yaizuensis TaxID=2989713 RepID=A0ABQ5P5N3_9ACTN|nr:XdhC/CoxI family protein [Streptomyces sp. YSPA8]GLF97903.1 XdhC family protein [Streptomyces sp. YSPA8]